MTMRPRTQLCSIGRRRPKVNTDFFAKYRTNGPAFRLSQQFENEFLQALSRSSISATVAWGIHDMAAPLRVADYSWKTALESRKAPADFWQMPCGNHYIQHDQPSELARIVRLELTGKPPAAPATLSSDRCSPVLVAHQNVEGKP
jgi:pimeloyl-ACP methyl ester carboxylesterase